MSIDRQVVPVIGQILFTLDKPEMFLKEFLSSCKIFYVESINNLQSKLVKWEDCLEKALNDFTGCLIVVSHDLPFIRNTTKVEWRIVFSQGI